MGSFSGLGIGLSFLFGCILMGLVAELYYLLWWKKRLAANHREVEEFSFLFCWRKPASFHCTGSTQSQLTNSHQEHQDLEMGSSKNLDWKGYCEEGGIETELMRAHNLCGPPRFLFTIKEESKEDLELSEDGKSRKGSRTRSLSDLLFAVDGGGGGTPFLTPLSSPPTVRNSHTLGGSYNNPLFESLSEAEVNKLRSSPPPKFKFLKDAEDKLIRRLLEEEAERRKKCLGNEGFVVQDSEKPKVAAAQDGKSASFVKNQASQVLPLASSPTFQHSA